MSLGPMRRYFLTGGCVLLAACGPRNHEILAEHKAFSDEVLARMPRLADAIDAMALAPGAACQAPAKLTYAPKADTGDTDYIMYADVRRAGKASRDKDELSFHSDQGSLPYYLVWAEPSSEYYIGRSGQGSQRATPGLQHVFESVKKLEYLVVIKPRPIDRAAGEVVIDTYLADFVAAKPLCGFTVTAGANPGLGVKNYVVVERNLRTGAERVIGHESTDEFQSALWTAARAAVFATAAKQLGVATPK